MFDYQVMIFKCSTLNECLKVTTNAEVQAAVISVK